MPTVADAAAAAIPAADAVRAVATKTARRCRHHRRRLANIMCGFWICCCCATYGISSPPPPSPTPAPQPPRCSMNGTSHPPPPQPPWEEGMSWPEPPAPSADALNRTLVRGRVGGGLASGGWRQWCFVLSIARSSRRCLQNAAALHRSWSRACPAHIVCIDERHNGATHRVEARDATCPRWT